MALYLTNIAAMQAYSSYNKASSSLTTVYQRLSSGLRINSAKDDSAGLQISARMTSQIKSLTQASRNASDGQAVAQTAEGAIEEITNMLQRIRTLANQAANGTNTDADRQALNAEVQQLCEEITRISEKTTFGGATLLNGAENAGSNSLLNSDGKLYIQVGADAYDTIGIDLSAGFSMQQITAAVSSTTYNFTVEDTDGSDGLIWDADGNVSFSISTAEGAQAVLAMVDSYISYTSSRRAELGAVQNRLDSVLRNNSSMLTNLSDARSRIQDTDYAELASELASSSILEQASILMLKQAFSSKNLILQLLQS